MNRKVEIFTAYGSDVTAALRNWEQIDQRGYDAFASAAVGRQYLADYRRWDSRRTIDMPTDAPGNEPKPATLFGAPPEADKPPTVEVRSNLVYDGTDVALMDLAGIEGAAVIRHIATRDAVPAATTIKRCEQYRKYADLIEAKSAELGRPVSVREALGLVAA